VGGELLKTPLVRSSENTPPTHSGEVEAVCYGTASSLYSVAVAADSHTTAEYTPITTAPRISAPRSHNTTNTTGTGSSKNLSYARPIAPGAVGIWGRPSVLGGGFALRSRLTSVSGRRAFGSTRLFSLRNLCIMFSRVAGPTLEGGQMAILRLHAAVSWPRNKHIIRLHEESVCTSQYEGCARTS